jgi:hypothetical protein
MPYLMPKQPFVTIFRLRAAQISAAGAAVVPRTGC